MTEAEWFASVDAERMRVFLASKPVSLRKVMLFRVGCCRIQYQHLTIKEARQAVDVAELLADGQILLEQTRNTWSSGIKRFLKYCSSKNFQKSRREKSELASRINMAGFAIDCLDVEHTRKAEFLPEPSEYLDHRHLYQIAPAVFRELFGNPFRPVAINLAWLTSTAVGIAQGIYDDRAFDRLPILADALQDAGCENEDILAHCRDEGPHVRGCWVVDLVLGKE